MSPVPFRVTVGTCDEADSLAAATGAARVALRDHESPRLALIFATFDHDPDRILAGLRSVLGPIPMVGESTFAQMSAAGYTTRSVAVVLLSGPFDFTTAARPLGTDATQAAQAVARECSEKLGPVPPGATTRDLAVTFLSAERGEGAQVVAGLKAVLGDGAQIFGGGSGAASDGSGGFKPSHQFHGGASVIHGVVLLVLRCEPGSLMLATAATHGMQPISTPRRCTRSEDGWVHEVDGENVFAFYEKYLGQRPEDVGHHIYTYPILIEMQGGGQRAQVPFALDRPRGRIAFYPVVPQTGETLSLAHASRSEVVRACRESAYRSRIGLGASTPAFVLAVSCDARRTFLGSRTVQELDILKEVFGPEVPVFGMYSTLEVAPVDGSAPCGSHAFAQTFCVLAFGTGDDSSVQPSASSRSDSPVPESVPQDLAGATAEIRRLRSEIEESEASMELRQQVLMKVIKENIEISHELTASNLGLSEANQRNQRLLSLIRQYTPQQTWTKAGANVEQGNLSIPDEKIEATYLFLDVKGYTRFSENHTPEEVIRELNRMFAPVVAEIYANSGDIHKFIGDAVFALFDDAVAAMRAATAIASAVGRMHTDFALRIGLNAGPAIHGNVGTDLRRDNTLIGDAVNLAQRMESACTPGCVLMTDVVYQAVRNHLPMTVTSRTVQVKGKADPVEAWEYQPPEDLSRPGIAPRG